MRIHKASRVVPQRGLNFEYMMWIFTRLSGAGLWLSALSGMGLGLYMGFRYKIDLPALFRWAFFPNSFHVVNSDIPDVAAGWINAWWNIVQGIVFIFASMHGLNGLRSVIEDYLGPSVGRTLLRGCLFLMWLVLLFVAYSVILASG
jgi:succinate dehydrogenase hydrophobic anchor subunit